ncbi:MAG: heat-inducible transcriptional repressor HrcA [Candidatus Wallbacteria bacterium]|nr:heat-inducible transcriptional repressor HrcA [Candidatus Wallbacteria bacterium]
MNDLTERQKRILKQVIDGYISSPDPVASRTVCKDGHLQFSAATVRNEMMELEEKGYLSQPHTSAGRVPTDQAYRFYIDYLMELERLSGEEEKRVAEIRREYEQKRQKIKEVLKNSSQLLADITNLPGISLTPIYAQTHFHKLNMVSLGEGRVLILLLTREGIVRNLLIQNDREISQERLDDLAVLFNKKREGFKLEELKSEMERFLEEDRECRQMMTTLIDALNKNIESMTHGQDIMVEGASRILGLPEFRDSGKLKMLLELIENKEELIELLNRCISSEGVKVLIGSEMDIERMRDFSLVFAPYQIAHRRCGSIGILGPTRVNYSKVISAVSEISRKLTEILESL